MVTNKGFQDSYMRDAMEGIFREWARQKERYLKTLVLEHWRADNPRMYEEPKDSDLYIYVSMQADKQWMLDLYTHVNDVFSMEELARHIRIDGRPVV